MIMLTTELIEKLSLETDASNTFTTDVINELENHHINICVLESPSELYDMLDFCGSLHSLIDSAIDIYNYDLRKWVVDNYNYIEDAMEEGLCEGVTDFHKLIQIGQYHMYQQEMYQCVEAIFEQLEQLFNDELED